MTDVIVHVDESNTMTDPFIKAMQDLGEAIEKATGHMNKFVAIWCFPAAADAGMRIVNKRGRNKLILIKKGDR